MTLLNVLLVEDDGNHASLIQHWLSAPELDTSFNLEWTGSLAAAKARLEEGGVDVVLLDLGLPDSDGLATFLQLRLCAPGLPFIILSAGESESLALETIRRGAQDYLVKNKCNRSLLVKSLQYAHVRHRCHPQGGQNSGVGNMVGFLGAKGGVGVTTVACMLSAELRNQTSQRVLLLDLDPHPGLVSFVMGLEPGTSAWEAAERAGSLDRSVWDSMVTHYGEGLDVLGSSAAMVSRSPDPAALRQLLGFVSLLYDWIVMDLGRPGANTMGLLEKARETLLVTTPHVAALYAAKHLIEQFTGMGLARDRLHLLVNKSEAMDSLGAREIDRLFGAYVYAELPFDAHALQNATAKMRLPAENSPFRRSIAGVACKLAGVDMGKTKPGLAQWLASLARPRHPAGTAATR